LRPVFNTLGNLNFTFACEQFNRTHLTHVHAHWIGGSTKLRVNGGQGRLGLFLGIVINDTTGVLSLISRVSASGARS
jgi:hypothetical protein